MKVLVAYASRHGATRAIAGRIAATLADHGHEVDLRSVSDVTDVTPYDGVVLGSAVYFGSWMTEATRFARQNLGLLALRPVWLFSSGPVGPAPPLEPQQIADLGKIIEPRGHRVFYGALDRAHLSLGEKFAVGAVDAPDGDYRDWPAVTSWAEGIAADVTSSAAVAIG